MKPDHHLSGFAPVFKGQLYHEAADSGHPVLFIHAGITLPGAHLQLIDWVRKVYLLSVWLENMIRSVRLLLQTNLKEISLVLAKSSFHQQLTCSHWNSQKSSMNYL